MTKLSKEETREIVDKTKALVFHKVGDVARPQTDSMIISGFGNLIATESREKQYRIFKVYRFAACWVYGFAATGFAMLLTPLIYLWLGSEKTLAYAVVICILIDFYFKGDRIVLSNFKTAAGGFEQDKYLALIQV